MVVFLLPLFRQICYGGGLKAAFDKPFAGVGGKGKQAADAAPQIIFICCAKH